MQVVSRLADNALAAFAKVIVDVHNANRNGVLSQYTRHPSLKRRFNEGWMVQIGFGLHIGTLRVVHALLHRGGFGCAPCTSCSCSYRCSHCIMLLLLPLLLLVGAISRQAGRSRAPWGRTRSTRRTCRRT